MKENIVSEIINKTSLLLGLCYIGNSLPCTLEVHYSVYIIRRQQSFVCFLSIGFDFVERDTGNI